MDDRHFDRLTRMLAAPGTRRRLLGVLVALPIAGGLRDLLDPDDASGKGRRNRRKQHQHPPSPELTADKKKRKKKKKCKPQAPAKTCAGKCGKVQNNCKKTVECGPCVCQPACPACSTCNTTTRACIVDPSQAGQSCGDGRLCQANGACACDATSCKDGQRCCNGRCIAWSNQTTFGSQGTGSNNLTEPTGIALAADKLTVWVADTGNDRVSVWTRPDARSTAWSNQTTFGSDNPAGLAVSADTLTVWVVESSLNRISVWQRPNAGSSSWSVETTIGSRDEFNSPQGVAVSADALTMWVSDSLHYRVAVWTRLDTSSAWSSQASFGSYGDGPSEFNIPAGIAVSADELTVWVVDSSNHRIAVWTRPDAGSTTWSSQTTFGSEGDGPSQFNFPEDIAVSTDALTVWVTDGFNARISIWTRPNVNSTAWSSQTTFGRPGFGPSEFQSPVGVAISADARTVWVVDKDGDRVAVWDQTCPV